MNKRKKNHLAVTLYDPPSSGGKHRCDLPSLGWWSRRKYGICEGTRAVCHECGRVRIATIQRPMHPRHPRPYWKWAMLPAIPPRRKSTMSMG